MADRTLARESERFDVLSRRIAAAAPGNPAAVPAGLEEAEFIALTDIAGSPRRILLAGPGAAFSSLLLALAWPQADVVAIDPEVAPRDSAEVARLVNLHGRLRVETGLFASAPSGVRPVGPEVCAAEEDFDLILVDGAADSASRAADLRLAASAVAPGGLIAVRGVMGRHAATVRAGVFDFLRFNWSFHYLAVAADSPSGGLGLLRARAGGWFPSLAPPAPMAAGEVSEALQAGLAAQVVALAAGAPLVEVAVGAPLLDGVRAERGEGVLVAVSPAEATAAYADPIVARIAEAVDGGVLFTGDLADFASDEMLTRLFDRLADRNAAGVFAVTPPGEPGVAGPASRPAARLIDLAASQNLVAYAPAGLEYESVRHADAKAAVSSRHLSLLLFARAGGRRDAVGRLLVERTPAAAAQHEQVELQRLVDQAALQADAARHRAERERAEGREQDLAARLRDKTQALDIANDTHERARRAWEADQRSLRDELRTQTDLTAALKTALDAVEETLGRERQQRAAREAELQARIAALEQELAQQQEAARIEAERLRWDMAAADAREQAARDRLGQARDEIASLQDDLRTAQGALKSLTESDTRMRQRAEVAEARLAAAETRIADLQASSERELARVKMSLADEVSRGQRLLADAQAAGAELNAARDALATLSAEHARVREAHAQANAALAQTRSDGARLSSELAQARNVHANALARLRDDHSADLARVRQAALSTTRPEDAALIRTLKDANVRLEEDRRRLARDAEARRAEIAELQRRLAEAGEQAIDLACREVDLQASLDGVEAHLALSEEALERVRHDPEGYRLADQTYPQGAPIPAGRSQSSRDLVEMAHALHGRAADFSRDLGRTLEAAAARRREALEAIRASHAEALARAGDEAAAGEAQQTVARLADLAAANEAAVRGLEASILRERAPPISSGAGEDPETRLREQGRRLEQVLRRLEDGPEPVAATPVEAAPAEPEPVPAPQPAEAPAAPDERPFLILPTLDELRQPPAAPPEAPSSPPEAEPAPPTEEPRAIIDDLAPEGGAEPDLTMIDMPGPAARRSLPRRTWDWLRAYRETFNIVRLQKTMQAEFARGGVRAKVFDADYYRIQGPIPEGQEPLQHYLLVGESLGRRPLRGFDPAFYRKQIGDRPVQGSLLRHFFETGVDEGRSPCAELEPIARRALAAGQSRLEYFFRREDEARRKGV